ncbi:phosphotriesterase-related protein [Centruroides vittatus]|uniref:phosphotriesterase-related protein n=1 Tax=Centruroides vittatus TaxID=120091 RepID=UPI00350F97E3
MDSLRNKVQTVLGVVDPSELGRTLTHEHLSLNSKSLGFEVPDTEETRLMQNCPFTLENFNWISQNPYSHLDNVNIKDAVSRQAVLEEMKSFKLNGGGTVVENTTYGLNRDIEFLKQLSMETGVHVVAGTGYYIALLQDKQTLGMSVEELIKTMKKDLLEGVGNTDIKCGVIGELGCSYPLEPFERNVLRAAGDIQSELKCPVIIHPGRDERSPQEVIRILQEAGGIASKTVMSHLERTIFDLAKLSEFASNGCYCEFDLFGLECSYYTLNPSIDMPNDAHRIMLVRHLIRQGFGDKIVISHDIHTKHRLGKYGGHGFSHIFKYVLPKMLIRDINQQEIDKILIYNPRNWLTY